MCIGLSNLSGSLSVGGSHGVSAKCGHCARRAPLGLANADLADATSSVLPVQESDAISGPLTATYLTAGQVGQAAHDAGFSGGALVNAVAVAGAESSFRLDAEVWNANEHSCGLWQINVYAHPSYSVQQLLSSASYNASAAHDVFIAADPYGLPPGNWIPWSTFNNGAFTSWLTTARAAAQGIDSTVIRGANDRVTCLYDGVRVRPTPGGGGSTAPTVNVGAAGTVLNGPVVATVGTGTYAYVWWYISWDGGIGSGWSAEDFLSRTATGVSAPVLIAPGNSTSPGPTIGSISQTFQWYQVTNATSYLLQVKDITAATGITTYTIPSGSTTSRLAYPKSWPRLLVEHVCFQRWCFKPAFSDVLFYDPIAGPIGSSPDCPGGEQQSRPDNNGNHPESFVVSGDQCH